MKKLTAIGLILILLFMVACSANIHVIGNGPQTHEVVKARQWYALWGLLPINDVDTNQMAGGATDYQIKTERSATDIILNIFTGYVTIYSRTVTVTK